MTPTPATPQPLPPVTVAADRWLAEHEADLRLLAAGAADLAAFKPRLAARGLYEQRTEGAWMLRVKLPGGVLPTQEARLLAELARTYAGGGLHLTTRQAIQLHGVKLADTPALLRRLDAAGLTSRGGGGNAVRGVTACPYAGVCPHEAFDVTPFAAAISAYLLAQPGSFTLPRKLKYAFSGCRRDCAFAAATDLGYVAVVKDGQPGFELWGGGGMGARPRPADPLCDFIPAADAIRAAEAIRRIFDRHGDRANRARARLRFAVEAMGAAAFQATFASELAACRADPSIPAADCPATPQAAPPPAPDTPPRLSPDPASGLRVAREKAAATVSVKLFIPLGLLPADDLTLLAELADRFSTECGLRATQDQNLLLRRVRLADLPALASELRKLATDGTTTRALDAITVCTGAGICRLGSCQSRTAALAVAEALETAGADLGGRILRISGCPNACGQHHLGEIGLSGCRVSGAGASVSGYQIWTGARLGAGPGFRFASELRKVSEGELPAALVALVTGGGEES
ncbi:MAG: nitrite/sulfite reductase [Lentisphaeria bacterium]